MRLWKLVTVQDFLDFNVTAFSGLGVPGGEPNRYCHLLRVVH
jgi:hypothetical protein